MIEALSDFDVTDDLPRVRAPTLVFQSREAPLPDISVAQGLASQIQGASPVVREGTPAVKLRDHVPDDVSGERLARLIALARGVARRRNMALVGSTHEVLVEGRAKRGGLLQTRTRTNKVALVDGPDDWIGTYRRVRLTGTTGSTFTAWPVEQELALWA